MGAKSATVLGSEGWLCGAMATAVMVGGTDSPSGLGSLIVRVINSLA